MFFFLNVTEIIHGLGSIRRVWHCLGINELNIQSEYRKIGSGVNETRIRSDHESNWKRKKKAYNNYNNNSNNNNN